VNRAERDELLVISNAAGIVGETLSLDLIGGGEAVAVKVRVIDSRPVIIDGTVRHRVRLSQVQPQPEPLPTPGGVAERSTALPVQQRIAEAG
jgi:hypothetical protein